MNWARFVLLFHIATTVVCFAFGLWIIPVLLSVAPFIANWHAYLIGCPMHAGLRTDASDFRLSVRTITLPSLSEFLYWHMNWHLEHHMFAAVPCYNLKTLHHTVAGDMPKPRSWLGSWVEMRRAWHQQKAQPDYAFETPLPDPAPIAHRRPRRRRPPRSGILRPGASASRHRRLGSMAAPGPMARRRIIGS